MNGVPTDAALEEEFRADYLYTGNASKSGRKVGLNDRTARDLARRANEDPVFTEARRKLRAQYLDDCVAMRMKVVRKAVERFMAKAPEVHAEAGAIVTIIDKRADYGKVVLDAEKNAQNLARLEAEKSGEILTNREVKITIAGPDETAKPSE